MKYVTGSHLLTIGDMIGDFTAVPCDPSGAHQPDNIQNSFLFGLKNPQGGEEVLMSRSPNGFGQIMTFKLLTTATGPTNGNIDINRTYVNDTGIDGKQVFTSRQHVMVIVNFLSHTLG
jgi:hypothetical protein